MPLVSVIALCFNHERFVWEALTSIVSQTYANVELIVLDDASTDGSANIIQAFIDEHESECAITFIALERNIGNCRAFNLAFAAAKGDYIIDFATDDILMPNAISHQITTMESLPKGFGVTYSDAELIDEAGKHIKLHSEKKLGSHSGDIYAQVLRQSFICTPTMLVHRGVLEELGGYDEGLSYEDFDFWVRSSRHWKYHYIDKVLVKKRLVASSHGKQFYATDNAKHLESTLKVCKKAMRLNRSQLEDDNLAVCIRYHMRQSLFMHHFYLVTDFASILTEISPLSLQDRLVLLASKLKLRLNALYRFYLCSFPQN